LCAQDSSSHNGKGMEINFLAGKIIKHSAKFTAPVPDASVALDVNVLWQTYGKKDWHQRRGFPVIGLGFTYTDYLSKNIFGRCLGVYPNLQVPIIRSGKFEWTLRFGLGVAYVNKKYQLLPNYDTINTAISTNLNAFAVCITDIRYHVNEHLDIQAGANFSHISNALYREPNLGVNMCGGHVGLRYFPGSSSPKKIIRDLPQLKNRWLLDVRGAISHKEARAKEKPIKAAYIGAVSISRRWLSKNKVFVGIDAAYHKDVYAFLINYGVELGQEKQNSWDGGFFAGNEFMVGRVGLLGIVGVYYLQTFLDFDPIYQKLGAKYYVFNREKGVVKELFLSAMLNTHGVVAEYAEFGMGVSF
jgi:hypothetical protein